MLVELPNRLDLQCVNLEDSDEVIAPLDGSQVDDHTAWEIGYFNGKESPEQKIIRTRTDFRRSGESEGAIINAVIERWCVRLVLSKDEFLKVIKTRSCIQTVGSAHE
jgi:nucleoside 2-deoxyribosyltransferase